MECEFKTVHQISVVLWVCRYPMGSQVFCVKKLNRRDQVWIIDLQIENTKYDSFRAPTPLSY